jgi:hypothetical protein
MSRKLVVTIVGPAVDHIDRLAMGQAKTTEQIITEALSLYRWMADEMADGRTIETVSPDGVRAALKWRP